jgi:hypothetical protein
MGKWEDYDDGDGYTTEDYQEAFRICTHYACLDPRRGPFVTPEGDERVCVRCYRIFFLQEDPTDPALD